MLKKFLKEVVVLIAGKQAEEIVDLLDTKKHVNEFIIAKKLNLTINQTRNILYKIADHGLVSSIRKKDKRKGWYTYFWKIENLKTLEFLKDDLLKKISNFENQIKSRETKRFYVCERCHIELTEENALLHDFTCNECGSILVLKDNTKVVNEMKKSLDKLRKDLDLVEEEVRKEAESIEKQKLKERRKEEKARKETLRKRRKLRAKIKKTKNKRIRPSEVKLKKTRRSGAKLKKTRQSVVKLRKQSSKKQKIENRKKKFKKTGTKRKQKKPGKKRR